MDERPRCLDELNRAANYELRRPMHLSALILGAHDLLKQARIYEAERDLETAYILFCRSYRMLSEDIPRHPDFGTVAPLFKASGLEVASTQARQDIHRLQKRLETNYNAWKAARPPKDMRSSSSPVHVQSDPKSERVSDLTSSIAEHAAPPSNPSAFPSYSQHRKSPRPSLMSPDEMPYIPMLRINEPSRPTFLRAFSSPPGELHSRSLSKNMSKEENTVENSQAASSAVISSTSLPLKPSGMVRAPISPPAVSRNFLKSLNPGPILDHTVSSPKHNIQQQSIPPRPPKIVPPHVLAGYRDHSRKPTSFIPIYDSNLKTASPSTSKAIRIPITSTEDIEGRNLTLRPSPDYSVARRVPSSETGACPVPKTESGQLLRSLILPSDLVDMFAAVAASNTERNIETCGWIMGRLSHNIFSATLLIIPKQSGTSDMCTTRNEEEILLIAEEENVITLGWIHTHPQHDLFLSSRDLHTQAGYQQMLPEAIAVVLAPRDKPSIGIFRLTDPPGLSIISQCKQGTNFHLHPYVPLYTEAGSDKGGHVTILPHIHEVRLIDLRDGE